MLVSLGNFKVNGATVWSLLQELWASRGHWPSQFKTSTMETVHTQYLQAYSVDNSAYKQGRHQSSSISKTEVKLSDLPVPGVYFTR